MNICWCQEHVDTSVVRHSSISSNNSSSISSSRSLASSDMSLTLGLDDYNNTRTTNSSAPATRICSSIDVRNKVSHLASLRGCRVVEGFVQIVLIDHANDTDYDQFSFPELREITNYLLFYRVSGLRSVGQLFPSLAVIRGNAVFQDYALVIYEMFHLQDVGLRSLTEITRGAVRIEKNPILCFLNTINWDLIARWDAVKNYIAYNKHPADCPGPSVCQEAGCPLQLCWSNSDCQIQPGDLYKDCHPQCMGGCSGPGPKSCHSCRKYLTVQGECVSTCPNDTYIHLNLRCVTKDHCLSLIDHQLDSRGLKFVVFNGTCIQNCPPGYDFTKDRKGCEKCEGKCRKVCPGLSITNVAAAQTLRGCTFINGSLEIAIKHGKHKILAQELEEGLQSVEQIKGYLKVIRCFPLVNLKFFKSLETIHGYEPLLENSKYSLIVLDNQNLQELWDIKRNGAGFKILNGRVFFHYNPKLCYYHIENLISVANLQDVNHFEVAKDSNGDKFSCNTTKVNLTFSLIKSTAVVIDIVLPNRMRPVLQRYVLYYTVADSRNMTMFEETDECDDDSWKVRDVLVDSDIQQVSTLQPNLEPFTQYAFYVKTYTIHSVGGQSPIYYIRTLPSRPSKVSLILSYSNHSSTIVLQWEPPKRPHGVLAEYIVQGFWQRDERTVLDQRDYCEHPLVEDTAEISTPNLLTNVENEAQTCCPENQISYKPKDVYGRLCENPGQQTLPFDSDEDDLSIDCRVYRYDSMNHYSPIQQGISETTPSFKTNRTQKVEEFYNSKRSITNDSYPYYKKTAKIKSKFLDTFLIKAQNNTTSLAIINLHHFTKYTIFIRACRETRANESHDYNERCSKPEIFTIRTMKQLEADDINSNLVNHQVIEEEHFEILQVSWSEPDDPNGVVLAFEIEHRRTDLENAKSSTECTTYLDYIKNGKSFRLKHLHPGKYAYRIRAISLAGPGTFTKPFEFEIAKVSNKSYYILLLLVLTLFIGLFTGGAIYILHKKRRHLFDLDTLLASINSEQMTSAPYLEDSWEIPREQVHLIRELGKGTFGQVYEGLLRSVNIPCAVKVVTDSTFAHSVAFRNEVTVMKRAAGVHHIVQLLGIVSAGGSPLIVMELLALGDLKTYLRSNRETPPPEQTVLKMAAQIGDAMFFLESNKFVHRDLAARNCLVSKDLTVKVGDFGLTRDVHSTDYYRTGDGGLLPVRWMAPESLKDGIFTSRSDVWSYGVVLWEIATLAELPYRGLTNEQVRPHVVSGGTLPTPVFCPEPLRSAMELCWKREPTRRPDFHRLVALLDKYTDDVFKSVSYYRITQDESANSLPQVTLYY